MKLPTHLILDISNKIKKSSRTYFFFHRKKSNNYRHLRFLDRTKKPSSYKFKIFSSFFRDFRENAFKSICHWHRHIHLQGLNSPDFYVVRSLLFLEKRPYLGQYWKAKKKLSLSMPNPETDYYSLARRDGEYLKTKKILPAGPEDSDKYFMNCYPNSYFNINFLQKQPKSRSNWTFFNKNFFQKERVSGSNWTYFNINFLRKERLYTKLKYSRCPQYDSVSGGIAALLSGFLGFLICEKFGLELLDSGDFYIAFMYAVFLCFSVRPFLKILSFENSVFNIFSLKILCKFLLDLIYLLFTTLKYYMSSVSKTLSTCITYVFSLIR